MEIIYLGIDPITGTRGNLCPFLDDGGDPCQVQCRPTVPCPRIGGDGYLVPDPCIPLPGR